MSGGLHLTIATPETTVVDAAEVQAVRAADESGGFGILPGHADLLTVLPPTVVRWHATDGTAGYCAVRGGVLTVTGGNRIAIACRQAQRGAQLADLEAEILTAREAEEDTDRQTRVAQMKLHARAIRQLMRHLADDPGQPPHAIFGEHAP